MKKNISVYLLTFLSLPILFSACEDEYLGETIVESRAVPDFSSIRVNTLGNISLISAVEYKVILHTHAGLLNDIWTNVTNDELQINLMGRHRKIKKIDIEIYAPTFARITLDNVANISCPAGFATDSLEIIHKDVGSIDLRNIVTQRVYVELNDVGDVRLSGTTVFEEFNLHGVGSIRAYDLFAQHCNARLTGVGDIEVNVSETLNISHHGVGKVKYKGHPMISMEGNPGGKIENRN